VAIAVIDVRGDLSLRVRDTDKRLGTASDCCTVTREFARLLKALAALPFKTQTHMLLEYSERTQLRALKLTHTTAGEKQGVT
jgi:hypothetical protein